MTESEAVVALPQYRCHKIVHAAKITSIDVVDGVEVLYLGEIGTKVRPLGDWMNKHRPYAGGYLVVYEDGYKSYSPAKAFEEGYTRAPVTFRDRVMEEEVDLSTKLGKLRDFISGALFSQLAKAEQQRLTDQVDAMTDYAHILRERIDAFGA